MNKQTTHKVALHVSTLIDAVLKDYEDRIAELEEDLRGKQYTIPVLRRRITNLEKQLAGEPIDGKPIEGNASLRRKNAELERALRHVVGTIAEQTLSPAEVVQ